MATPRRVKNPFQPSAFIRCRFKGPQDKLVPIKGLIDSGNLTSAAAAIQEKLAHQLQLNITPCNLKVGTAAKNGQLQVVGEVRNLKMALSPSLVVCLHKVLVLKDLNSPLNLSLNFLRSVNADLNFRQKSMRIAGENIPLIAGLYNMEHRLTRETDCRSGGARSNEGGKELNSHALSDDDGSAGDGSSDSDVDGSDSSHGGEENGRDGSIFSGKEGMGPSLLPNQISSLETSQFEEIHEMCLNYKPEVDFVKRVDHVMENLNIPSVSPEILSPPESLIPPANHFVNCNKVGIRLGGGRAHRVFRGKKSLTIETLNHQSKASNAGRKLVVKESYVLASNCASLVNCQLVGSPKGKSETIFVAEAPLDDDDDVHLVEGCYSSDASGCVQIILGNSSDNVHGLKRGHVFHGEILKRGTWKVPQQWMKDESIGEASVTTNEKVNQDDTDQKDVGGNSNKSKSGNQAGGKQKDDEEAKFADLWKDLKLEDNSLLCKHPDIKKKVKKMIYEYRDVFSSSSPGKTDLVELDLKLKPGTQPIRQKLRPLNPTMEADLQKQLEDWLSQGVIEGSDSPWSSPLVPVKKKDGTIRWAVDFRRLNRCLEQDSFPLPRIAQLLERAGGHKVYSTLDAVQAYFHVSVNHKSRKLTAFATPNGLYQFKRMPFGISTAPAIYSRFIAAALNKLGTRGINCYLDDVLVYSMSLTEHVDRMYQVLQAHREAGVKLKPAKTSLFQEKVEYLGHMLSAEGIGMIDRYVERIKEWPVPSNPKELNTMLGFFGYYRSFIKSFASLTASMMKQKRQTKLEWTPEMDKNFKILKEEFVNGPVRAPPQFDNPNMFQLTTDYSTTAIAAVLSQVQDGEEKVIGCLGRKTTDAERRYPSWKGEMSAIVYGCRKWSHILSYRKFIINTDSKALTYFNSLKANAGMVSRWAEELQAYDMEVRHRPGRLNINADCLSRRVDMPEPTEEEKQEQAEYIGAAESAEETDYMENLQPEQILKEQAEDDVLKLVRQWVVQGHLPEKKDLRGLHQDAQQYAMLFETIKIQNDGILIQEVDTSFGHRKRILVPDSLKEAVFRMSHQHRSAGHFGVTATVMRVRRNFWYPALQTDVRTRVATCLSCLAKVTKEKLRAGVHVPQRSGYPLQTVFVDLVGPLSVTSQGNQYILSVEDGYSRFIRLYPLKNKEARGVVEKLADDFIGTFGCPGRIHSDNGREFCNTLMDGLTKRLDIVHTRGPPYNAQSNSVERFHRTLNSMLRVMLPREDKEWDKHLPAITLAFNTKVNQATGVTPSLAFLGREAKLPVDLILRTPDHIYETVDMGIRHMLDRYTRIYNYYTQRNEATIRRNTRRYAAREKYNVGDEVWYLTARKVEGKPKKLTNAWIGPFIIQEKISEVLYRIRPKDVNSKHKPLTANISRLKKLLKASNKNRIPNNINLEDEDDSDAEELSSGGAITAPSTQIPIHTPTYFPMMRDVGKPRQADGAEEVVSAPSAPPQVVQDEVAPLPPPNPAQAAQAAPEGDETMEETPPPDTSGEDTRRRGMKRGSEDIAPSATKSGESAGPSTKISRERAPTPATRKRKSSNDGGAGPWTRLRQEMAGYEAAVAEDTSSEEEENGLHTLCIPIKRGAKIPYRATSGSAGWDLYTPDKVKLPPHSITAVDLGLSIALPANTYLQLASRSGLASRGIQVIAGVIDSDYTGRIKVLLYNHNDSVFTLEKHQRCCQGLLIRYEDAVFQPVDNLPKTSRDNHGFGHSG